MNDTKPTPYYRYRSLFWPIMLIGVGVVWLLGNLGLISSVNIVGVLRLWPLLLIAIGADIIFGRQWPAIGGLIAAVTVVAAIVLLIAAPALGLQANTNVQSGRYSEPVGNATSARIELGLSGASTTVSTLSDSPNLIDAKLQYIGNIDFHTAGDANKTVTLRQTGSATNFWMFDWIASGTQHWDIGLNAGVPMDLNVAASSGESQLNLNQLKLTNLAINASSGSMSVDLPAPSQHYAVTIDASSGSMDLTVPANADMQATVRMSSGSMSFSVPNNAAVRIQVLNSSSGSVNVPGNYAQTENRGRNVGTWESPNFNQAERKIVITVEQMSSGSFDVR